MKKSNSESSFLAHPFDAKPPLSANAANITSKGVRMGQSSAARTSGPTSPTSAPDLSPFRSTSTSPRRHMSPDCKLKLVSAGNSFCLVKEDHSPTPSDDIRSGRKSPFITSRSWPKALRTRSASKERVSSRQGILQNSIEQIKAFQETKLPDSYFPPRWRDSRSDSDSSCDRTILTKSTSMACLSRPRGDTTVPKGILKTNNYPQVPRVNERIRALQNNIDETKSKPMSTLPWNSRLCKNDSGESMLRKTASSPCLFVKKSSVKIKTRKSPIKLYSTITNVSNLLEEKLSHIASKELHEWESNENQQHTLRDSACMGKSHEVLDKTFAVEVPAREVAVQDSFCPPHNSIPCDNTIKPYDEVGRTIEILDSEVKRKGGLPNEQARTAENVSCIQNEQLKFNEITLQNKIQNDDIPQRGSARMSNKEIFKHNTPHIQFPHIRMENKDFIENVNISGNSIHTESEDSDRPQNSTCLLSKQIGLPSELGATSGGMSHRRTCNEPTQSQTCDNSNEDQVHNDNKHEKKADVNIRVTKEDDEDIDKVTQLEKDLKSLAPTNKQENNEKPIALMPEHMNSSEDEEIQKELSSILTNGHEVFKGQLPQPRCFNNPFMNDATTNRQSLKNLQNNANTTTVISESKFVGISNSLDTWDDSLQDKRAEINRKISENAPKSSFNLTSELEDDISKISINHMPRPIIPQESAKLISFEEQENERSVDGKGNEIKGYTKSAPKITHLGNRGVGVHNMYGAVPQLLGSRQFRTEREAGKSDLYTSTCEIQIKSGISTEERRDNLRRNNLKVVFGGRKNELEQSDLSESGSHQDESSPPRDSPSPESSSSENEVSEDEFSKIRQRSFNNRRGSMPEREIDEEDTETAELQVNLRKISGRSFIPSVKLDSVEKDENDNVSPQIETNGENEETKEVNGNNNLVAEDIGIHRRLDRRGSMPEREINEDDTETAEFQTNLRKLSAKTQDADVKSNTENQSSSEFEDEITPEIENMKDCPNLQDIPLYTATESAEGKTSEPMNSEEENKQIFRPAIPARGRTPGGLRRSRTWQGFGSGLRYESVSDAGLPPPPPTPNGAKSGEGKSRSQLPSTRQSLPRSYRPLSNLRRNPESGPKSWRRPTGSAFPSTTPVVGHSTARSLGEQGGIARSLSEGSVLREWDELDEEVEYECRVTCSVRQPNQDSKMSVDNIVSEDTRDDSKMRSIPVEVEDKVEEDENGREDLTPAQIQQLMSVIAGMESIKKAGGEDGNTAGSSGSPPPTDEEIQQFIEYVGMGVINNDRIEYEERRRKDQEEENQPEPPKRNKQASQYFWRRHYLSIIQEDEEEHNEQTPGSSRSVSRANSRPGSTYENNFNRLSRVLGAMSPLALEQRVTLDTTDKAETIRDMRASWGSEMSVDSLASVNSILSEEGSITSNGSFLSDSCPTDSYQNVTSSDQLSDNCQKRASQSLSYLLDSVHPPSNTPDSMMSCESPTVRLSKTETENDDVIHVVKFKMGSKFKQSIQEIEESKRKGKREFKECSENSPLKEGHCTPTQVVQLMGIVPSPYQAQVLLTSTDPPSDSIFLSNITPSLPRTEMERTSTSHPLLKEETPVVHTEELPLKEEVDLPKEIQENVEESPLLPPEESPAIPQDDVVIRPFKSIPSSRLRKPRGGRRSWEI